MNTSEAIRTAADEAGMPLNQVSRAMGRNDNFLSATLGRGSVPKADTLATVAGTCGYSLALIPKGTEPPGALVIDPPEATG